MSLGPPSLIARQARPPRPSASGEPMLRSRVLVGVAEASRRLGVSWADVALASGIPAEFPLDPFAPCPADRVLRVINAFAAITGREDVGVITTQAYHAVMGNVAAAPLRLAMRAQPTLGGAIRCFCQNVGLHSELEAHEVEEVGELLIWKRSFRPHGLSQNRHMIAVLLTASVLQLRDFLGPTWRPYLTRFSAQPPRDPRPYAAFFGQVEFGADFDGLVIEQSDACYPLPTADPATLKRIEQFLAAHAGRTAANSLADMEDMTIRLLLEGDCTLERMAAEQGVDRRTVHRRLQAHGVSFSDLLDRARRELVETQIGRADRSLSDVAAFLGFSGLSTFSRWFHDAYGMTASAYRKRRNGASDLERQKALMDATPQLVLGVGLGGAILFCNPAIARLGYAPQDLVGRALPGLAHPDDQACVRALARWDGPSGPAAGSFRMRTASGGHVWLRCAATTLFDREGGACERLLALDDVDELMRLRGEGAS